MTPPEHLLVGMTSANILYSAMYLNNSIEKKPHGYLKLLLTMGLTAMLPDIDTFFGNYTSTDPWVGHRGMTHSFVGVGVIGLGVTLSITFFNFICRMFTSYWRVWLNYFKKKDLGQETHYKFIKDFFYPFLPKPFLLLFLATFIAGVSHLIADLPQPGSDWGGIPLLWPFKQTRFGGWGIIGWFDLKVLWILFGAVTITIPFVFLGKLIYLFKHKVTKIITVCLFGIIFLFSSGVLGFVARYIAKSKYENNTKWYASQIAEVDKMPDYVKNPTHKGIKIFMEIFKQSQKFTFNP